MVIRRYIWAWFELLSVSCSIVKIMWRAMLVWNVRADRSKDRAERVEDIDGQIMATPFKYEYAQLHKRAKRALLVIAEPELDRHLLSLETISRKCSPQALRLYQDLEQRLMDRFFHADATRRID